ncbi:MAG: PilZ domain-containing protein [Planctomycetota bacterium]|nr:PilZ domain-containing protein [Planctomycetota bacterium]
MGQSPNNSSSRRPNTLGLDDRALEKVLGVLDGKDRPSKPGRAFLRWPFRRTTVPVLVTHPSGQQVRLDLACRNLSRGGMSLLHASFLHMGTRCTVTLRDGMGQTREMESTVVRCRHCAGMIHEIGVRFDEPVDVRDFVPAAPLAERFALEAVDPSTLEGLVAWSGAAAMDQMILKHLLRKTRLTFVAAATFAQPWAELMSVLRGARVILIDDAGPQSDVVGQIRAIRGARISAPIIVLTFDRGQLSRQRLAQVPADEFLAKPLTEERLLRALGEFLVLGRASDASAAEPALRSAAREHLESFASELSRAIEDLERLMQSADAIGAFASCQALKGTAACLGFTSIARLADRAGAAVASAMSVPAASEELRALVRDCQRVRGQLPASDSDSITQEKAS